jgi:hypothetical protein
MANDEDHRGEHSGLAGVLAAAIRPHQFRQKLNSSESSWS